MRILSCLAVMVLKNLPDCEVYIWHRAEGTIIEKLKGHTGSRD
jgi:hypothetical protein